MKPDPVRRLTVIINGRTYLVQVDDLSTSPVNVIVNGVPYEVELEPNVRRDEMAGDETLPAATPLGPKVLRRLPITPTGPAADQIVAPMPGDILDIAVSPGDRVTAGQQICALEAMKMKSAIRSPREGVIRSVDVSDGQSVGYGDVLVTFE